MSTPGQPPGLSGRTRLLLLVAVMALVALCVASASIFMLYRTSFSMEADRLAETARGQARLIESIARYHTRHNDDMGAAEPRVATIVPVVEGFRRYEGFGQTGEISLARREGDLIVFKLRHRLGGLEMPAPMSWASTRAEPMRRALSGQSGTMTTPDYRGVPVLAAYEPIVELEMGIVAKIDMAEIRAPFVRAALACVVGGLVIVLLGAALIRQISAPFLLRESAERAARESEARFRDFAEGASDWLWERTADGRYTLHASTSDPRSGAAPRPEAKDLEAWEEVELAATQRRTFRDLERRWVAPDGSERVVRLSGKPVYANGAYIGSRGTGSDITAMVAAEAKKAEAEHRLVRAMDASPAVFALFDKDDRLVVCNRLYRELYETPLEPIFPGAPFESLVRAFARHVGIGKSGEENDAWVARRLARRSHLSEVQAYQRGDGEWIEVTDTLLDDGSIFTVGTVVTQRKAMEAQLRHSQRMDAIGQLTGGVAHDFNNLLAVIRGNLEFALDLAVPKSAISDPLLTALRAVERGADLTQHLLAFSRSQALKPQALDLDVLVHGTAKLLRRTLGESITIEIRRSAGLPSCIADPAQLENVLLNLALNARDAMPNGGRLTIGTAAVAADGGDPRAPGELAPGPYVVLSVVDEGNGMSAEVEERAFEPFFTTKDVGQGSGLGLSMVHGFAKQSGGHVTLATSLGKGTTVAVYLPAAEPNRQLPPGGLEPSPGPDAHSRTTPAPQRIAPSATEGILLVEDDADVRSLVARMLVRLGYRPLEAADGDGALAVLDGGIPVDLMLVDLVLPGRLSGPDLAERACDRHPSLKVLFCSGYDPETTQREQRLQSGKRPPHPVLAKPFDRDQLARAIRAALDRPLETDTAPSLGAYS